MTRNTVRKILHLAIGIVFLIIGLVGLVLPILNGLIFILLGFIIISIESPYVERKLISLAQKNKIVHALYLKLEKIVKKILRK